MLPKITARTLANSDPVQIAPDLYIGQMSVGTERLAHDTTLALTLESMHVVPSIPRTGLGYWILEGGWIEEIIRAYGLWRLQEIKQLGMLEDPDTPPIDMFGTPFTHTRFLHSLDVHALVCVIIHNNQEYFASRPMHANVLRLAALTHDDLTPAGGDTTKSIDFETFDEDRWYKETLKRPNVQGLVEKYNIDTQLLIATVLGQGVLGDLLDIADKLAYTALDAYRFEGSIKSWLHDRRDHTSKRAALAHTILRCSFGRLWESVTVDESGVYVRDAAKLRMFLRVRALMFHNLYTHPNTRCHDSLMMHTILKFLYQTKRITKAELLAEDDHWLFNRVREFVNTATPYHLGYYDPRYRGFDNVKAAKQFEHECLQAGNLFAQVEDVRPFFKPGTHLPVLTRKGPTPFATAYPYIAKAIESLGQPIDPIRVYYLNDGEPTFRGDSLQAEFRAWRLAKEEL